jgi:hypothetical protein
MADERREYDSATITVALEGPHTFEFTIQDWDVDDRPLGGQEAWAMAHELVISNSIALHGHLDGKPVVMQVDRKRVVGVGIHGTGKD